MTEDPKTSFESLCKAVCDLRNEAMRKDYLDHHPDLLNAASVEHLAERVRKEVRIDTRRALALAEVSVAIAERLSDPEAHAKSLRAKANALWFNGDNKSAVELHARAASMFEETGNQLELGRTLSGSIQPLILLGEYDRALSAAKRAEAIFGELGDTMRLARLQINLGNIFYRQDRFQEALECYEKACQELSPDQDAEGITSALHNVAVCFIGLNAFRRAHDAYEQARKFADQYGMPLAVAQADYNIAYLHYLRGEYSTAIEQLRRTRENCEGVGDTYHSALCYLDLSEIYLELNLSQEAYETAEEAFRRFERLGMGYEAAKSLAHSAIALGQQGKAFRANELFARARGIFVKEKNRVWPSVVDLYEAMMLSDQGRYLEARRLALESLAAFARLGLAGKHILCRLLLAELYLKMEQLPEARQECVAALQEVDRMTSPALTFQAHFLMGKVEEAQQNPLAGYEHYQAARQALETLRSGLRGEELKIAFMKDRLTVYENLVALCLSREGGPERVEEAWTYMEQAKSRSLRDLVLQGNRTLPVESAGESRLVGRIRELREELNWYYHRLEIEQLRSENRSEERIQQLETQARRREAEFLRTLRELPVADADSEGLETAEPPSLGMVREALPEGTTLIEYFRARDQFLAAVITRNELSVIPLTPVSRVNGLLRMLRFQLSKFMSGSEHYRALEKSLLAATQGHLSGLYQELIAPLRSLLEGEQLIIVPHGVLHYLPFHALFDGERYLIDIFRVSYAPSATLFALCQGRRANADGPSLILGVPDPQTPFILHEVHCVSTVLPNPEVFLSEGASEAKLREIGPRSRFIHIVTHGHFREDNPMFSGIRMGQSYLRLCDFYYLKLPAELITLSGCSTGLSVIAAGDELLGLARGLLGSGAQTLLLTLWDVYDRSTAEFMKAFYTELRRENDKTAAFQTAMRKIRDQFPHPFYWAPFILVGRTAGGSIGA